jgi:molybdate transport system substrate-binding protein
MKSFAQIAVMLAVATLLLTGCRPEEKEPGAGPEAKLTLDCYVGGTMLPVMERLAEVYEKETGVKVLLDKAGSGENYLKIQTTGKGDLNVAHAPYLIPLLKEGLAREGWTVGGLQPVLCVQKGNPKGIKGLKGLLGDDIRLGITHREFSTLGHILPIIFKKAGITKTIEASIERGTEMRSGGQTALALTTGNLDACIVWNAVAELRKDKLDVIPIEPEFIPDAEADAPTSATYGKMNPHTVRVFICTLAGSDQPEEARKFAQFVDSAGGRKIIDEFGFSPSPRPIGQPEVPAGWPDLKGRSLLIYAGAGLSDAVLAAGEAFTKATGAKVESSFGGSGVLLSTLKTANEGRVLKGDLFMPGSVAYVKQAEELGLIASIDPVAWFVPVIIVQLGNPKGIKSLQDLTRCRLARGNPDACQVGRLTVKLFKKNGIDAEAVKAATVFESMTVNELGTIVGVGNNADAAIVWDATAAQHAAKTDIVKIPFKDNIISAVSVGLMKTSQDPEVARAFIRFLTSPEGKAILSAKDYRVTPVTGDE